MGDLTKNFSSYEFKCPCCGKSEMDPGFMKFLQEVRFEIDKPFAIIKGGGYRCEKYNGSALGSHTEGKAADLAISRRHYFKIIYYAMACGVMGIGVKNKNGKYQIHLDTATDIPGKRPRPWIWTY